MVAKQRELLILGTRGIPARHGGFETFAERIAAVLVSRGWRVAVYCQVIGTGPIVSASWKGVELIQVPVARDSPLGTLIFDASCMRHACGRRGLILMLGYNTGFLALLARIRRRPQIINMDGMEWRRAKWSRPIRLWLYINEWLAAWLGNHLIADHPAITQHLQTRVRAAKITMIPYGADRVTGADASLLDQFKLNPQGYAIVIARPEPENSLLEIVAAFSRRHRNMKLVVLGEYRPKVNRYHERVMAAAGPEVQFIGAIYDKPAVNALRVFSRLYVHGHRVGGTNPSLLEAMGAGCAILANDNVYNRWVAGPMAGFFNDEDDCADLFDQLLDDQATLTRMRLAALARQQEQFRWDTVITQYEHLLTAFAAPAAGKPGVATTEPKSNEITIEEEDSADP